jgi:hypothetical protein
MPFGIAEAAIEVRATAPSAAKAATAILGLMDASFLVTAERVARSVVAKVAGAGLRLLLKFPLAVLERFPAKWTPVRVKKTRQNKNLELRF